MRLIIALLLLSLTVPAFAQIGPPDPNYVAVTEHRDNYTRVIFGLGDSIMRGYALGFFPDLATPEQKRHPWRDFRSPGSMFNALTSGDAIFVYAGQSAQPDDWLAADAAKRIRQSISYGIMRPGDVAFFEDAGDHRGDPEGYERNWNAALEALDGSGVIPVLVTMPDAVEGEWYGDLPAEMFSYSAPFDGLSHNDVTRRAARRHGAILVDLETIFAEAMAAGIEPFQHDGIHFNIAGQCLMVDAVADAIGESFNAAECGGEIVPTN